MKPFVSKLWFRVLIVMAVCVVAAWTGWTVENSRSATKLRRAENSLRQEIDKGLPTGSDKVRVGEFLKAHAIYSDGYRRLNAEERASYKGASGIIVASTEKIDTPVLLCRIVVTFRFDDVEKLEGYDDSFACRGPF